MMQEEVWINFQSFSGVDQSVHPLHLPLHASPDAQNMVAESGMLKTCNGFTPTGIDQVLPMSVSALMKYYRKDGPEAEKEVLLVVADNGEVRSLTEDLMWQRVFMPTVPPSIYDYINYSSGENNIVIITRENGEGFVWEGVANRSKILDVPGTHLKTITLCHERAWAAGGWPEQERVWYSKAFEPTNFKGEGSGFIDVPGFKGGAITALRTFFNEVVVFKDKEIFRIYGTYPGEFAVKRIEGEDGPLTHNTVVQNGDRIYFLNEKGICFYDGMRCQLLADEKLKTLFQKVRKENLYLATGIAYGKKVIFSFIEDGWNQNDVIVEYDVEKRSYMIKRGFGATCFIVWRDQLLMGGYDGNIYYYDTGKKLGTEKLAAYWKTPVLDLEAKHVNKISHELYLFAKGEGTLKIEADFGKRKQSKEIELTKELVPIRTRIRARGRSMQLTFSNVDGSNFEIHNPQLRVELHED